MLIFSRKGNFKAYRKVGQLQNIFNIHKMQLDAPRYQRNLHISPISLILTPLDVRLTSLGCFEEP